MRWQNRHDHPRRRAGAGLPLIAPMKKTRTDQGLTTITVTGVNVIRDTATATLDSQNELLGRKTMS